MSQIRFALIECGRFSSRHVDALANKVPKGKIVAVCDLIPELAERYSLRLDVPGFTSTEKMYKSVEIAISSTWSNRKATGFSTTACLPYDKASIVR